MINFFSGVSDIFNINSATLSGCMDIVVVQQPDGSFKSSPFHVRFGKLKLLKSVRKQVGISVNGVPSNVSLILGREGDAFFVRDPQPDEVLQSYEDVPAQQSESPSAVAATEEQNNKAAATSLGEAVAIQDLKEESQQAGVQGDRPWQMRGQENQDGNREARSQNIDEQQAFNGRLLRPSPQIDSKKEGQSDPIQQVAEMAQNRNTSPPKFAQVSPYLDGAEVKGGKSVDEAKREDFGANDEEQRKGLWRSIFGYFRAHKKGEKPLESETQKAALMHQEVQLGLADNGVQAQPEQNYLSEDNFSDSCYSFSDQMSGKQDSEIHMSLCLSAFQSLQPQKYCEMRQIFEKWKVSYEKMCTLPSEIISDPDLVVSIENNFYPWAQAAPMIMSYLVFKQPLPPDKIGPSLNSKLEDPNQDEQIVRNERQIDEVFDLYEGDYEDEEDYSGSDETKQQFSKAFVLKAEKAFGGEQSDEEWEDVKQPLTGKGKIITRTPSTEQLASLGLQPGENLITFLVHSRLQGEQKVSGKIFLWDYRTKIVISDVDGTITRSDVMGHVMPRFGNDWSHAGICNLFQKIRTNGYQMLYLTARAIGQANSSRNYINNLRQDADQKRLPPGPLIMSPDRLLHSFNREVILRKPQVFKIACLKNIVQLFPTEQAPFYCGFGNRETDAVSYEAVGVPIGKVFIINSDGEITQVERPDYQKTYDQLAEMTEEIFPSLLVRNALSGNQSPLAKLADETGGRLQPEELRQDWFVIGNSSEVGAPESSLHLRNLIEQGELRKRSLKQRVKDSVREKFGRGSRATNTLDQQNQQLESSPARQMEGESGEGADGPQMRPGGEGTDIAAEQEKEMGAEGETALAKLNCGPEYVCDIEQLAPGDVQKIKLLEAAGGLIDVNNQEIASPDAIDGAESYRDEITVSAGGAAADRSQPEEQKKQSRRSRLKQKFSRNKKA